MWGRLGYPRRALRLHACAVAIVERHGGEVPDRLDQLLALPGVGTYTARAVAAFAYGQRHPVVDTNVRRVVAGPWPASRTPGRPPRPPTSSPPRCCCRRAGRGGAGQRRVHGTGRGDLHGPRHRAAPPARRVGLRLAGLRPGGRRPGRPGDPSGTRAPTGRYAACCSGCCGTPPGRSRTSGWTRSGPTTSSAPGPSPAWCRTGWSNPPAADSFRLVGDGPSYPPPTSPPDPPTLHILSRPAPARSRGARPPHATGRTPRAPRAPRAAAPPAAPRGRRHGWRAAPSTSRSCSILDVVVSGAPEATTSWMCARS